MGETISYSFEVTNSGATTLTNVTVTDPLLDGANGTLTGGPSLHWHQEQRTRRPLAEATRSSSPTSMRRAYRTRLRLRERHLMEMMSATFRMTTATWRMIQRIRTFRMTVTYCCLRRARSTMRTVTASHSWARRSATASL
ncbi:hypothetical protein BST86_14605 [Nonlabens agnitus]|uniref:DUF7507 domain-containing protein n=1 Tax=Nonlabens agnitus TaxID=870484 RepID=A0A2S9WXW3_9FLAO|nr:hypothetical protein BST86_14605 [Nonlabens agnitus]